MQHVQQVSGRVNTKDPEVIDKILDQDDFVLLKEHALDLYRNKTDYEAGFGRYTFGATEVLKKIHDSLLPKARAFFESDSLLPSWCMMAAYKGSAGSLFRHTDDNACTYHFDVSVFQTIPWDIGVSHNGIDKMYTLQENQALAMYGEKQEHWRDPMGGSEDDVVINAFFFFCEPDHWYFTKGPSYIDVLRGNA